MVLRPRILLVVMVIVLALLAGAVALMFRHGGERLVARQTSAASAQALRNCLGARLGLTWQGDPRAMRASTFSLRVVVSDVAAYNRFLMTVLLGHPAVAQASSHFALAMTKYTTALPL